ncbi:MAG: hypothetical protein IID46_09785 [Planctomycetes bacterium]|nr:hypothetical protein [Planctomycetota bacterium]
MSDLLVKKSAESIDVEVMSFHQKQIYINEHEKELMPVIGRFGPTLNFFHRVVIVISMCVLVHVVVSLKGQPDSEKGRLVWTDLGGHSSGDLRNLLTAFLVSLAVFALLGWSMYSEWFNPQTCAALGAIWTFLLFTGTIVRSLMKRQAAGESGIDANLVVALVRDDRFWAGILCALAVFMHYYFY